MMKNIYTILLFMSLFVIAEAQTSDKNSKEMDGNNEKFVIGKQYVFKKFELGKVKVLDGTIYNGLININTITQTIHQISDYGDTVGVAVEPSICVVTVGNNLFVKLKKEYYQILETNGDVLLGLCRKVSQGDQSPPGAYGTSTATSSIVVVRSLGNQGRLQPITAEQLSKYTFQEKLVLISKGKVYVVSKKNFSKLFPTFKKEIETYIDTNQIDLDNKESVMLLFSYAIKL